MTVAAAELEATVCMLLVLSTGNDRDPDEMLLRANSKWRKELRKAVRSANTADGALVEAWLDRCWAAFDRRHDMVHSRWGVTPSADGAKVPVRMRPTVDQKTKLVRLQLVLADDQDLNKLADDLEALRREAGPLIGAAASRSGLA